MMSLVITRPLRASSINSQERTPGKMWRSKSEMVQRALVKKNCWKSGGVSWILDSLLNNDRGSHLQSYPSSSRRPSDKHIPPGSRGDCWSNCSHEKAKQQLWNVSLLLLRHFKAMVMKYFMPSMYFALADDKVGRIFLCQLRQRFTIGSCLIEFDYM